MRKKRGTGISGLSELEKEETTRGEEKLQIIHFISESYF
jgi:hypothetical protein